MQTWYVGHVALGASFIPLRPGWCTTPTPARDGRHVLVVAVAAEVEVVGLTVPGLLHRSGQREVAQEWLALNWGPVSRLCPQCGSVAHGRPYMRGGQVSLSYADGLVVAALADAPVGVDVEVDGPAPSGFIDLLAWCRAEAMVKASGEGLRRDLTTAWELEAWTRPLPLPSPYVGAVAVLRASAVRVSWRLEEPVAPVRRARN